MTVGELIELLSEQPREALVLVQSEAPEQGYNHFRVALLDVKPSEAEGYWDGEFQASARAPEHDARRLAVVFERKHEGLS